MKYIKVLFALFSAILGIQALAYNLPSTHENRFVFKEQAVALDSQDNFTYQGWVETHKNSWLELIEKIEGKTLSISDKNHSNKKIKYRTGSKRYKNNFHRLYRIHPMRIWLKLPTTKEHKSFISAKNFSISDELKIRLHKNLCVTSPQA